MLVVCWAQPVWEQLFGAGKGNLARLLTNASGGDVQLGPGARRPPQRQRPAPAAVAAAQRASRACPARRPRRGRRTGPFVDVVSPLLGGSAALVLLAGARRRARPRSAGRCTGVSARTAVGGVLGHGRRRRSAPRRASSLVTVGLFFAPHHVRWLWTLGGPRQRRRAVGGRRARRAPLATAPSPPSRSCRSPWPSVLSVAAVPYLAQQQGPVADYAAMPALRRVFRELEPLRAGEPVVYDTQQRPRLRAVQLGGHDAPPGARHRVPRRPTRAWSASSASAAAPTAPRRTRVFQLEHAAALDYTGPACRGGDRQRARPGRGGRGPARTSTPSPLAIASGDVTVDLDAVDPAAREAVQVAVGGDAGARPAADHGRHARRRVVGGRRRR